MSEVPRREWRFYVDDMLAFAEKVAGYTAGLDQSAFVANGLVYDATLRNLELLGEAATHVPEAIRAQSPQVPWRMMVATRNRLIHGFSASTTTRCGASSSPTCPPSWPRCARCRSPSEALTRPI